MTDTTTAIDLEKVHWTVDKLEELFGELDCSSLCIEDHWYDPRLGVVLGVTDGQAPRDMCNYFEAQEKACLDIREIGDDDASMFHIAEAEAAQGSIFLIVGGVLSTGQYSDDEYDGYFRGHFYIGTRAQADAAIESLKAEIDSWHVRLLENTMTTLPQQIEAISRANKEEVDKLVRHLPAMMQAVNAILQRQSLLTSAPGQA